MAILLSSNIDHFNFLPLFLNIIKGMDTMISITMKRTSLAIAMALACPNVSAADLGVAQGFSAFVFGDFTSDSGAAESAIFAKNDVELEGYSIRYRTDVDPEELSLIAGGEIDYESGRVYSGSILSGKEASIDDDVALGLAPNATISENTALPFNIEEAEKELKELSSQLQELTVNGTVDKLWGGLYLTGDGESEIQVFNIDGKEMAKAHTFSVNNIPNDSTIIFNISGVQGKSKKALNNKSFASLESHRTKTIFNFYESEKLDITGTRVQGVVLAPYANIRAYSGDFTMPVIAKSWEGSMHLGYDEFDGDLPDLNAIEIHEKWAWVGSTFMPEYNQVMSTPVVVQLNDDNGDGVINEDDVSDILFTSFKDNGYSSLGVVRALSGIDGKELWDYSEGAVWSVPKAGLAAADLDSDGYIEIVTVSYEDDKTYIYSHDGKLKKTINSGSHWGMNPSIADINNDGIPEIALGNLVFDYDYGYLFSTEWGAAPIIFDHDLDGKQEVFTQGTLYDSDGRVVWNTEHLNGSHWFSSVANFDSDQYPEIIVSVPDSAEGEGLISLLEHDGSVKWGPLKVPGGGGGSQVIEDLDGDGRLEIALAGYNQVSVISDNGLIKWSHPINDLSSGKVGVTAFDFNGNGHSEIVVQDTLAVKILDSLTGQELVNFENSSGTLWEYPLIVDLDGDSSGELVVSSNNYSEGKFTGIRVLDGGDKKWKAASRVWNQHSYHTTNINSNGTIPTQENNSWLTNNSYRSATLNSY